VFYDDVLYRTTFTLPYCIWNFYPILWLHAKFYLNRFILLPLINAETLNLPCFHVHYTVVAQAAQRRWTRLSNYKPSPRYNDIKIVQTSWCRSRIHNRCRWKATRANKNIKLFCSPTKAKSQPPNLIEEVRTILHLQTNTTHGFAASRRWRFGVNRPSRLNTITLEPFVRKKNKLESLTGHNLTPALMGKFGVDESTFGRLCHAKFYPVGATCPVEQKCQNRPFE